MIGVAISTHKRPDTLTKALAGWSKAMPDLLVVTNDARGDGVAVTKNRGLAALMDAGADHLFLADDDVWPVTAGWAYPYIRLAEPHLMHCWGKSRYVRADGEYTIWNWPRGVLLYVERRVVEQIGGMRTEFGRWGGEHAEWSRRIHNAGFTAHPFQDAADAKRGIWHCEDYRRTIPSTVPTSVRDDPQNVKRRHDLYDTYRASTDYVEYRDMRQLSSSLCRNDGDPTNT
jgi:hypothetical protein